MINQCLLLFHPDKVYKNFYGRFTIFREFTTALSMRLIILVTGGTFDKEYDELSGSLYFKETHVQEMLKLGRCTTEVEVRTLMMIDSLEMTDSEREIILDYCRRVEEDRIVITHGTDTMEITARLLGEAGLPKTI